MCVFIAGDAGIVSRIADGREDRFLKFLSLVLIVFAKLLLLLELEEFLLFL